MISVIRLESKISKRKLFKILKNYSNPVLIFSDKPLKSRKIKTIYTKEEAKKYLEEKKNVNLVGEITTYFTILSLFSIKNIRIIKKVKKIRKINFLTYDQMEILQLYFESIYNYELQYLKSKKITLILNQSETYLITSFDKISFVDTVECTFSSVIFKGHLSKNKINEILEKINVNAKKVKIRPNLLKIKVSNPLKTFHFLVRSYL